VGAAEAALRLRARWRLWWGFGTARIAEPPRPVDPARLARMEAALVAMPELTREVFMMHRFDGLPYRRVARRLDITIDEVEDHMVTALQLLGRAARGHTDPP
jgi:RNA polymerase sigma-70 factor (ECF subfamily)